MYFTDVLVLLCLPNVLCYVLIAYIFGNNENNSTSTILLADPETRWDTTIQLCCRWYSNLLPKSSARSRQYNPYSYDRNVELFQMKPTRCTLLLGIFISTSLHVSGNYVPIIRRTYCTYATLIFSTLHGWLSGLLVSITRQTKQPPIQSEKY